uniref:Calmodulin-binding domain-containing protein n=2 Tax=Chenopodium quinoa TaxID=63459 RepID=A0A803MJD8_CHEQI
MGANPIYEAFQQANDLELECKANKHEGILYDKQKNSSMWHLIYQHVKSAGVSETGNKLSERLTGEDQVNRSGTSSDADADADDSDASSVTSELTESDAIKLVKEAINDILNVPQDVEDELTPSNKTTTSEGQSIEVEENPKKSLSRGYSKLRKIIICNKFIKAMEKTRNFYPQTSRTLNSGSEPRNSHLTNCAVGERKGMDEWMLDNVLQKVIAGLAPVQQKRVSLLVKAFEKVNPDPEERAKRLIYTKTEFPDTSSSEGNTKEMEKAVPSDSSHNSELPGDIHLKLDRSQNSSSEVVTERVLQESCKDESPGLTRECALNGQSCSSGDPSDINAATSDPISNLSETNKDPTEIDATNAPGVPPEERKNSKDEAGAQVEEKTLLEEQEVENTELTAKSSKKPPQPEDLEDEWNYSVQNSRSLEKPTGLWGLILQHVSVDMLEKNESPKTIQIDANVQVGSSSTEVSDSKTDDSSQLSSRVKSCRDMGVQTPTSFEFEENEAIKLVEEAVEEILLLQDQICDTESITSGITSEKGVYGENKGEAIDPSLAATEIAGVATSLNTDATLEEKKTSSEENVPTSYSTLSKVVMCRRFVKAMNKMRKLKALHVQDLSQPPQSQGEGNPSLRQISTRDKASWEEGMLDNALQKVIGNLAPAKKQRVALLVQAFETVGSLPEPTNSWRGKASVL